MNSVFRVYAIDMALRYTEKLLLGVGDKFTGIIMVKMLLFSAWLGS